MSKKKRRRAAPTPTFKTTAGWRWRSFPVFFAFVCGAFVMGLLNGVTNLVGAAFFYLALFGLAFGVAHMVVRWLAERRMRRRAPGTPPPLTATERDAEQRRRLPEGNPGRGVKTSDWDERPTGRASPGTTQHSAEVGRGAQEGCLGAEATPQRNVDEPHCDSIVLDVETVRGPDEVGGWRYAERFGLAVAVTWDSTHGYREWFEGDAGDLVEELSRFDRVVGFNLIDFDYRVLAAYRPDIVALLSGKTVDILAHVHQALGFRVSLDSLARATLGRGKTSTGDQAIKWWRQGQCDLVASYCRQDVNLTRDLYVYGLKNGLLYYPRHGAQAVVRVNWRAIQT